MARVECKSRVGCRRCVVVVFIIIVFIITRTGLLITTLALKNGKHSPAIRLIVGREAVLERAERLGIRDIAVGPATISNLNRLARCLAARRIVVLAHALRIAADIHHVRIAQLLKPRLAGREDILPRSYPRWLGHAGIARENLLASEHRGWWRCCHGRSCRRLWIFLLCPFNVNGMALSTRILLAVPVQCQ